MRLRAPHVIGTRTLSSALASGHSLSDMLAGHATHTASRWWWFVCSVCVNACKHVAPRVATCGSAGQRAHACLARVMCDRVSDRARVVRVSRTWHVRGMCVACACRVLAVRLCGCVSCSCHVRGLCMSCAWLACKHVRDVCVTCAFRGRGLCVACVCRVRVVCVLVRVARM